jgi:hypothetical protein
LWRILALAAGAAAALVAVAWGLVTVLLPPARVRALVRQQLERTLAREVRFTDAGVGLLPPVRLTVRDVAVSEAPDFTRGTLFQARSIHLDLDVFALLGRRVVVRRLVLDRPGLRLVLHPDGSTNLDGLARPAPGAPAGAPMNLSVRELSIRSGRVLIDDLKVAKRRTFALDSRLEIGVARGSQISTAGRTTISDFAFGSVTASRLAELDRSLAALETHVEHRGVFDGERRRLALERLAVRLGRAEIAFSGVIDDPGPAARMRLKGNGRGIDFGDVLGYLAAADARAVHGVTGSGRLDFDLDFHGAFGPNALKGVSGAVRVADAAFRYPGAPVGVEGLSFTANLAPDSVGIPDLVAEVGGQPVKARLAARRFADPLVAFALAGDIDLAAIGPLLAPPDTKLGGRAAVNASGQGRAKDPGAMLLAGGARLKDVSVASPLVPRPVERVNGAISFSQTRARIEGLSAAAGGSSFALDADVARPLALLAKPGTTAPANASFSFRSPRLDVAEVVPQGSGPPIVLNATGGGDIAIARLVNHRLDVSDVRARVELEPGIVRAPRFSLKGYGGRVGGTAALDLRDPARPAVSLDARADSLSADALLSAWTPARDFVHGTLGTSIDFSVAGATPQQMMATLTAAGVAGLARGRIGPGRVLSEIAEVVRVPSLERLKFQDGELPFRIENGRVITGPAVLRGESGEWRIAGGVGFDGTLDYAVSATLPSAVAQALGARSALAAGVLADENGNLLIDLRVGGTAKAPKVSLDTGAMRDRVAGRVSQALEEQKAKLEREVREAALARQQAAADSARRVAERLEQAVRDSLRRRAGDVLRGFLGGSAGGAGGAGATPDSTRVP